MDKQLLQCRAADAMMDAEIPMDQIVGVLGVKKSSVYNMTRVWTMYHKYHPTLKDWSYTQLVTVLPVENQIPDFISRMDIDATSPLPVRALKEKVSEYQSGEKERVRAFNLTKDDDYIKIEGKYIALNEDDKKRLKMWLASED